MISPYPISQIFYPPISHIPDFLPPNIPYPRCVSPPPLCIDVFGPMKCTKEAFIYLKLKRMRRLFEEAFIGEA